MQKIKQPKLGTAKVYNASIRLALSVKKKARLALTKATVLRSSITYKARGKKAQLFKFKPSKKVAGVPGKTLKAAYARLANGPKELRAFYDTLRSSAPFDKCPYCRHGDVGALDHYLPKKWYPVFALTPLNLVPACDRCNKRKGSGKVGSEEQQFAHPYFDNFDSGQWLHAKIHKGKTITVEFQVKPPRTWNGVQKQRILFHFKKLSLASLFASNAISELAELSYELDDVFQNGSADDVSQHLKRRADSIKKLARNSWRTALYQACANSQWFCAGGFRNAKPPKLMS